MAKRYAWIVACALLAICFGERVAVAQSSLDLTWDAPPGCPDRASVVASVERLVTTMPPQPLHVTAVVAEEQGRFRVALEMHGAASGTRTLHAASCASLARAAALVVAIALDPEAATVASDELDKKEAAPAPPPVIAPSPPVAPTPPAPEARRPRERVIPFVTLGASAERALLPGVAIAASLGGGVAWRVFRADLHVSFAPSASTELARVPSVGGDFSYVAASLRGCVAPVTDPILLAGCMSVHAARIQGEGRGADARYEQTAWLTSLDPGALVRFPARSALALEVGAEMVVPLTRPSFVVVSPVGEERLFRVVAVGVRASAGIGLRF